MIDTVPLARPYIDTEEEAEVLQTLRSGWISQGPKVAAFEKLLSERLAVAHVRAVNSGSSAIQLALMACGVAAGDEVIVPSFTCIAAIHPIVTLGAVPVPVDISPENYALAPELIEQRITPRTRVIMVAHLFGFAAHMPPIEAIASAKGIFLLEDLALSLGTRVGATSLGGAGDAAVLSFHPRKMLTTGEGGAVVTRHAMIAERVESLRNYGSSVSAWKRHTTNVSAIADFGDAGFNYKMTDIQASIGLVQCRKLDEMIELRRALAHRYNEQLSDLPWLKLPSNVAAVSNCFQSYVIRCVAPTDQLKESHELRQALAKHLHHRGVASVQAAQVVTDFHHYRERFGWTPSLMPQGLSADRTSLALPIFPAMTSAMQEQVVEALHSFDSAT